MFLREVTSGTTTGQATQAQMDSQFLHEQIIAKTVSHQTFKWQPYSQFYVFSDDIFWRQGSGQCL